MIHLPFRPYPAAMPVYDTLDGCQANAGPLEIISTMKTLKNAEAFIVIGHVVSWPVGLTLKFLC